MLNQLNITTVWIFLIAGTQLLQPKKKKILLIVENIN